MDEWLTAARDRIAALTGDDPDALVVSQEEIDILLKLSGDAAHTSVRTNAPLVSYLVGLAVGRKGASMSSVAAAAHTPE